MNKLFWTELKLSFHMGANQLLYQLQHLPIIKRFIKDKYYAAYDAKMILGMISLLVEAIKAILVSVFYLFIVIAGPMAFVGATEEVVFANVDIPNSVYYLFYWTSFILGSFINVVLMENSADEYMLLHVLRVNPKRHYRMLLLQRILLDFFRFVPLAFFIGFGHYLCLYLALLGYRMLGETIRIKLYEKFKIRQSVPVNIFLFLLCVATYVGYFMTSGDPLNFGFVVHPIHVLVSFGIGVVCFLYLWRYPSYNRLAKELVLRESLAFESDMDANAVAMEAAEIKVDEKKLDLSSQERKHEKKKGYAYLNALFFERHQQFSRRLLMIKGGVILAVLVVLSVILLLFPSAQDETWNIMMQYSPAFVFLMYLMSSGKSICSALFFNCDRVLLKYGYYRKGRAVLENFFLRIGRIMLVDLIPAGLLSLIPVAVMIISGHLEDWPMLLLMVGSILCLSIFFSVYHVFCYYICQPYTEEMAEQSTLFRVLNALIYVISYFTFTLPQDVEFSLAFLMNYNVVIWIVTMVFIVASFFLVYYLAPKRFRLR